MVLFTATIEHVEVLCTYTKEADAKKRVEKLEREKKPCRDCGDSYFYFAHPIEVLEEFEDGSE